MIRNGFDGLQPRRLNRLPLALVRLNDREPRGATLTRRPSASAAFNSWSARHSRTNAGVSAFDPRCHKTDVAWAPFLTYERACASARRRTPPKGDDRWPISKDV